MSKDDMQVKTEAGQTMAEYTVVLGVITLAIVATFALLSEAMQQAFERTVEIVQSAF